MHICSRWATKGGEFSTCNRRKRCKFIYNQIKKNVRIIWIDSIKFRVDSFIEHNRTYRQASMFLVLIRIRIPIEDEITGLGSSSTFISILSDKARLIQRCLLIDFFFLLKGSTWKQFDRIIRCCIVRDWRLTLLKRWLSNECETIYSLLESFTDFLRYISFIIVFNSWDKDILLWIETIF